MEAAKKVYSPYFFKWELFFTKEDGYGNRAIVAKAFADFWATQSQVKLEIPGKCMLGGYLYGHEKYKEQGAGMDSDSGGRCAGRPVQ